MENKGKKALDDLEAFKIARQRSSASFFSRYETTTEATKPGKICQQVFVG